MSVSKITVFLSNIFFSNMQHFRILIVFLHFLFLTLASSSLTAQIDYVDNINQEARKHRNSNPHTCIALSSKVRDILQNDTLHPAYALSLRNTGMAYYYLFDYSKAIFYLRKGLNIGIASNNLIEQSACHNNLGLVLRAIGKIEQAKFHFHESIEIDKQLDDFEGMAYGLHNIAELFLLEGQIDKAIAFYNRSLQFEKQSGNIAGVADTYQNIGTAYFDKGSYLKSLEYYNKALRIYKDFESLPDIAMTYANIGTTLLLTDKPDLAIQYIQESINIRTQIGDKLGLGSSYLKMGEVYNYLKNNEEAEKWFFKGMTLALETGNYRQLASGFNHRGLNLLEQGDTAIALQYLQNSLEFARNLKANALIIQLLDTLSFIAARTGQFELAYYYMVEKENTVNQSTEVYSEQDISLLSESRLSQESKEYNTLILYVFLIAIIAFLIIYVFVLHKRIRKIFLLLKTTINEAKR